jgi:hypothetical protein
LKTEYGPPAAGGYPLLMHAHSGEVDVSLIHAAIERRDVETIDAIIRDGSAFWSEFRSLIEARRMPRLRLSELHALLGMPGHHVHQMVAFALQLRGDPSTAPVVRQVLSGGFEHLDYTASDDAVLAKWHSWILFRVATEEAHEVLREFANSPNQEIAQAMRYRSEKIKAAREEPEEERKE